MDSPGELLPVPLPAVNTPMKPAGLHKYGTVEQSGRSGGTAMSLA